MNKNFQKLLPQVIAIDFCTYDFPECSFFFLLSFAKSTYQKMILYTKYTIANNNITVARAISTESPLNDINPMLKKRYMKNIIHTHIITGANKYIIFQQIRDMNTKMWGRDV